MPVQAGRGDATVGAATDEVVGEDVAAGGGVGAGEDVVGAGSGATA